MVRREAIVCPDLPKPVMGSHALKAGDFVFLGGQLPTDYRNGLVPEVDTPPAAANSIVAAKLQSDYILRTTQAILKAAGSSLQSGVRIDQFVTRPEAASPYLEVRSNHVEMSIRPASTHIQLQEFLVPRAIVTLELIGVTDRLGARKEMIYIEEMPKSPAGPFRGAPQGVKAGGLVFLTGQIASDFKTGVAPEARTTPAFWYGSPIKLQTEYVLKQLRKVLEAGGSSLKNVVRADVYLTNMADVYELEEVWKQYFPENPPARTIVPVVRLGAADCLVEINMIAVEDASGIRPAPIAAKEVPPSPWHHPHAVRAGDLVFISGLCATETGEGSAPEARIHPEMPWFGSAGRRETDHILKHMSAICRAAGSRLENVVWMQGFYTDLREFQASLESWERHFPKTPPAAFVAGVHGPHFVPECSILFDAVAIA